MAIRRMTLLVARFVLQDTLLAEIPADWDRIMESLKTPQDIYKDDNNNTWVTLNGYVAQRRLAAYLVKVNRERVKVLQDYRLVDTEVAEVAKDQSLFVLDLHRVESPDVDGRVSYGVIEERGEISRYQSLAALAHLLDRALGSYGMKWRPELYTLTRREDQRAFWLSVMKSVRSITCHVRRANPHPSDLVKHLDGDIVRCGADEYLIGARLDDPASRSLTPENTLIETAFHASDRHGNWEMTGVPYGAQHMFEIKKDDITLRYVTECDDAAEKFMGVALDILATTRESGLGGFRNPQ